MLSNALPRTRTGGAARWVAVCACVCLAACATKPVDSGPSYPWPRDERPPPPILVRSATLLSTTEGEYVHAKEAVSASAETLLGAGRVGPLGLVVGIVLVPFAVADARAASRDYCPPRARQALGRLPEWVESTFGPVPVLANVADAARRQLRGVGGPAVLESSAGVSPQARTAEVIGISNRVGVSQVILADVHVQFGEMVQGCKIKLVARADVRVQPPGEPEMVRPRFSVWVEQPDAPVEEWATNPDLAQKELCALLGQLGGKLIDAYRDRMDCAERGCDW
jgi:hypothetical protein